MNQNRIWKEAEEEERRMVSVIEAAETPAEKQSRFSFILEQFFKELSLSLYVRDRNGNLELNRRGKPKFNLGFIPSLVAKIIVLSRAWEALSK